MSPFAAQIARLIGAFHRSVSVRGVPGGGPGSGLPKRREIVRGAPRSVNTCGPACRRTAACG
jgi:hypothetical protein